MQHGEGGAALPRGISNMRGRELRDLHNNGSRWTPTTDPTHMFSAGGGNMERVRVARKKQRKVKIPS